MYSVRAEFPKEEYLNDIQDIPRAFYPYLQICEDSSNYLNIYCRYDNNCFCYYIDSDIFGKKEDRLSIKNDDSLLYKKYTKRFLKNGLYDFISDKLNIYLPYGSLTGVRPTKLYRELEATENNPKKYLKEVFKVTENRAELIKQCVENQRAYINSDENTIGLFLNIPFCPTRCTYCSFISTELFRVKKELPLYIECVAKDLAATRDIVKENGFQVGSIYVGGGTPSCIGAKNMKYLLSFLSDYDVEFTVEIGRPDTINEDILQALKESNVTRISVNPQTFHQRTLDEIGRKHTVKQIIDGFNLAKNYNFDINMDLIAALPNENFDDFSYSINACLELSPQNITIHTLSLKRGALLIRDGAKKEEFGLAEKMVNYAYSVLDENGYLPYYMYRQKNMSDNLENVGFCLDNKQCKYNIDMMEETASIIGAGAGSISKVLSGERIERLSAPKGFREYCDRIEKIVDNKKGIYRKK